MKKTNISFEGMSHNLQYVFTNKGVVKLSEQLKDLNGKNFLPYTYNNLNIAIDIMKENFDFKFKTGQLDLVEYAAAPRRFLTNIIEIYRPENSITLIKEWENIFGGDLLLINESVDKLIIESRISESWESFKVLLEQWYNPADWGRAIGKGLENIDAYGREKVQQFKKWGSSQINQVQQKGIWNYAKEKGDSLWKTVKEAVLSVYTCVTNNPVECLMEGLRSFALSPAGMAVMTGVSMIPALGEIPTVIIYGALLIWDLYKMMSGKEYDISNIVIEMVSMLLPALGIAVKGAMVGIRTFSQLGAKAASKGGVLLKIFNVIKGGLSTLGGYMAKAATWFGEKLGITSMKNWGSKATLQLNKLTDEMVVAGKSKITNKIKYPKDATTVGQKIKKAYRPGLGNPIPAKGIIVKAAGKSFLITTALCAALGLDGDNCQSKIESGEVTPEQIKQAELELQQKITKAIQDSPGGFDDIMTEL
jgi:hypothetical protein